MTRIKAAFSALIFTFLLALGVATFAGQDKEFSQIENRTLQTKPKISLSAIYDGSFIKELSDYLCDQFPLRDTLVKVETKLKLLCGKRDISNTYIGKDGYLFEKVTDNDIDKKRFEKNLSYINSLAAENKNVDFKVMLIPSSGVVLSDKLPFGAQIYDAESLYKTAGAVLQNCKVINPTAALQKHKDEYIYYRTDHHWTTKGAYYAYLELTGRTYEFEKLEIKTVTNDFSGTLNSRVPGAKTQADSIETLTLPKSVKAEIDGKTGDVYNENALSEKDKYQIFFGGNFGNVTISGGSGSKSLLIIKDSFANCLVPFLTADYKSITMIDPRYYSGSVRNLLESGKFDEVLVLYELNNFASDSNVSKIIM